MSSRSSSGFCPLPASRLNTPASVPVFGSGRRACHPLMERVVIVKDIAERADVKHADPSRAIDMQPL